MNLILYTNVEPYIFFILLYAQSAFSKRYDNYSLFRGVPMHTEQVMFYKNLTSYYRSINYWLFPGEVNYTVQFSLNEEDASHFSKEATRRGIDFVTIMKNVQQAFDMQTVKKYARRRVETFDWNHYYNLQDINNWLYDLAERYPEKTSILKIGTTHENRNILAIHIRDKSKTYDKTVIIEGGIHAREWIAPATVTYIINALLNANHSSNDVLKKVAKSYEFYIIPVLNPDGYVYTHEKDRMWRKNRRPFPLGVGVDLNRNFNFDFGVQGSSSDVHLETYCGPEAFSERESSALRYFIMSKSQYLRYFLSFHSFGQLMIIPYANSQEHKENYDEVYSMLSSSAALIQSKYGTTYSVGTAFDTIGYQTSGVSGCWVKNTFKTPYVATFELRDTGYYGFALPPSEIHKTSVEILDGVTRFLDQSDAELNPDLNAQPKFNLDLKGQEKNRKSRSFLDLTLLFFSNIVMFLIIH